MSSPQALPPVGRSRMRRIAFALIAVFGSTALCLGVLELALAVIQPTASYKRWYDESLTYLLDDDSGWKLEQRRYPWGQVNEYHLRGPAIGPQRTAGRLRILLLGGSGAFDIALPDDKTWAIHLEALLAQKLGRPVEVVNAGCPGYSTWQCYRLLTSKMLAWQPDAVILYELYNDSLAFRHSDPKRILEGWDLNARANYIGAVAHPCAFFDVCGSVLPHLTDYVRMALVQNAIQSSARANADFWDDPSLSGEAAVAGLGFYRENRRQIARTLEQEGNIPLFIVTQASLIRPDNTPQERQWIHYSIRGMNHDRLVAAYRQAWAIDQELPRECGNVFTIAAHEHVPASLGYFVDEVHLNHAGSTLLAKYVAQELIARSLLQQLPK